MLNVLIFVNWVVICLIGVAVVYSLALAVFDLVADVKKSKRDKASNDLYQQMLLDDVYYRTAYAELFSSLLRADELSELKNAVTQFIDDSKLVR